jgi:S1-C subfamily serine protease
MKRFSIVLLLWILAGGIFVSTDSYHCAAGVTVRLASIFETDDNAKWIISSAKGSAAYVDDKKSLDTPQLVLNLGAIGTKGLELRIDSDAAKFRIRDDTRNCELTTSGQKSDTLFLSFDDANGGLTLNGTEHPEVKGQWLQLIGRTKGALRIQFIGATFINVKFRTADSLESSTPATIVQHTDPVQPPAVTASLSVQKTPVSIGANTNIPAGADEKLQRTISAVFKLMTTDASREVTGWGTGFLVGGNGLAVTNFHVVRGASGGTAVFGGGKQFAVELCAVQPEYDLAIVKVKSNKVGDLPKSLDMSKVDPPLGSEVWAVGFPEFGLTVTKGIVGGLRQAKDLPSKLRKELGDYALDSEWIQTDCTINPGNSGGPLIGHDGSVIGVNTWGSLTVQNAYFAMDIVHARNLLNNMPMTPITFAIAARKYGDVQAPASMLPHIVVKRDLPASEISRRVAALATGMTCRRCNGSGTVTQIIQTGNRHEGAFLIPITETKSVTCTECHGSGYDATAFVRQATQLVNVIARASPTDLEYDKRLKDAATHIWTIAGKYPKAFAGLDLSREPENGRKRNTRGLAIMGIGKFVGTVGNDEASSQWKLVSQGNVLYVITDAAISDAERGDDVVFGGLIAGQFSVRGEIYPVLQYGFAMSGASVLKDMPR